MSQLWWAEFNQKSFAIPSKALPENFDYESVILDQTFRGENRWNENIFVMAYGPSG